MENGYHLYDFRGQLLREDAIDQFKQFTWRPRPERLLTKEEQKAVRKNLREYSKQFEEADLMKKNTANRAVVEQRRTQLDEWLAWRERTVAELRAERREVGLREKSDEEQAADMESMDAGDGKTIEEVVEEIMDETEEVQA